MTFGRWSCEVGAWRVDRARGGERGAGVEDPPAQLRASTPTSAGRRGGLLEDPDDVGRRQVGVEVAHQRRDARDLRRRHRRARAGRRSGCRRRTSCGSGTARAAGRGRRAPSCVVCAGNAPSRPVAPPRAVGAVGGERDLGAAAGEDGARRRCGVGGGDREAEVLVDVGAGVGRLQDVGGSPCSRTGSAVASAAAATRTAPLALAYCSAWTIASAAAKRPSVPKLMLMASAPLSAAQTSACGDAALGQVGLGDQQVAAEAGAGDADAVVGLARRRARRRACRGRPRRRSAGPSPRLSSKSAVATILSARSGARRRRRCR